MRSCFILILLTFMQINLYSQVPNTLSWQGIVQDNNGANLDGQFNITTRLFDVSSGGTALWTETQNNVQISDGLANLTLGEVTPLTISFNNQLWLEVQVGAGTPLPRIKLTSVPYALSSNESDPIFASSASSNILSSDISNWNDAFSWGDHSAEGYLKSFTESDPTWSGSADTNGNIYRNGNVGIGTTTPLALLHTNGIGTGEGNVLFTGSYKSTSPGEPPVSGAGTRLMWYPDKAAFRAGFVDGSQWAKDSIGNYSFATGSGTKASGDFSTAMGFFTSATGDYSISAGRNATASGSSSTAMGRLATASGSMSLALGFFSSATGSSASAIGNSANATGDVATALGFSTDATGEFSTSIGSFTRAEGDYSTAIGSLTRAAGDYSTSMGVNTTAESSFETVVGRWNTSYSANSKTEWNANDRLFVVGNGTSTSNRSNALTILKNGDLGVGVDQPKAMLHTYGTDIGEGNILFEGEFKSGTKGSAPVSGAGTRMMWYPDKSAFRVGNVNGTQWDTDSIGSFSIAMGQNTIARPNYSVAIGSSTVANGFTSFAIGSSIRSASAWETVIGRWNSDYTPQSTTSWNSSDRIFVIGNGSASNARSNAMTVLKNGRVGLQTVTNPSFALELPNSTTDGIGKGRANDWVFYSDGRLKTNRTEITYGLKEIMQLEPLNYFHHNSINENGVINISNEGANDIGFIAQDLFKILPEIVSRPEDESSDLWSVSYSKLTPVLVKAIQEQQSVIENYKIEMTQQKQRIEELEQKLELLIEQLKNK